MTSIDPKHGKVHLGDLLRFPHPRNTTENQPTDGGATALDLDNTDPTKPAPEQPADTTADDEPGTELAPDTERAPARRAGRVPPALAARGKHAATVTWRAAKPAGQIGIRHGAYTAGGAWELSRRGWARLTHGDLTEAIRAAKASGDLNMVAELEQRRRDAANDRWQRITTQVKLAANVLGCTGAGTVGLSFAVLAAGLVVQLIPGGATFADVWTNGWWAFLTDAAHFVSWVTSLWPWMLATVLTSFGYAAWRAGRDGETAPAWAGPQHAGATRESVLVTPDRIVHALKKCGIAELRNVIKETGGEGMVDVVARYGPGAHTTITLPAGVTADQVISKADSIAATLSRDSHELVLSRVEGHAGQISMWIADNGALDEPVPGSPITAEDYGPVDLYRDRMPWGLSPMGDPVEITLLQRHIVLAGLSKQGKTASARALALWAALDPSTELRIADLKGAGDWSMFDGLATTLIEGAGDENELATCTMLEDLCDEMDRRLAARRTQGAKGDVTSKEAKNGSGFHPLIGIVDEVQIAYMSQATEEVIDADGEPRPGKRTVGGQKNTSRLWQAAKKLHDQARAVNIHLWQFAQNPTDKNLPAIVREGGHLRASLYVSSPSIARMALGDAPVDRGAAPHRLRNEIDAGTVVLVGASEALARGQMSATVRTHYLSTPDAYTVAERAKQLRTSTPEPTDQQERDLLADVAHVLGRDDTAKAKTVVHRLQDLAPGHAPYTALTAESLAEQLDREHAVPVRKKDGYLTVRTQRVQAALADRTDTTPTDEP